MWFKKYWKAVLGFVFWLGPIWDFIKWCLDWRGRVDALATTYHDIGGYHVVLAYLLDPPSWLYPPFMIAGLGLIWWNFHRNREQHVVGGQANFRGVVGDHSLIGNPTTPIESPPIPNEITASHDYHWQFDSQMACEIAARLRSRPEWQDKIIVDDDVTPEYLWGLFHGRTSKDGDNLAKSFLNNWMVVCGPFGDVSSPVGQQMIVTFAFRNSVELVFMYFNEDWHDRLGIIIQNKKIAVVGRIVSVRKTNLSLEDCELVQ